MIGIIFSLIGAVRKKVPWYTFMIHICLVLILFLLFEVSLTLLEKVAQPDSFSTGLFWSGVLWGGITFIASFPKLLKEVWLSTNTKDPQ